jgi:hypothetical protein
LRYLDNAQLVGSYAEIAMRRDKLTRAHSQRTGGCLGVSPGAIDPEAYPADVIDCMAKGHPVNRLDELLHGLSWVRRGGLIRASAVPAATMEAAAMEAAAVEATTMKAAMEGFMPETIMVVEVVEIVVVMEMAETILEEDRASSEER